MATRTLEDIEVLGDTQYQEIFLSEARRESSGITLRLSTGWSIGAPYSADAPFPEAGEVVRLYGEGIGRPVRGIVVGGEVLRYNTPEEQEEEHREWVANWKREKVETFEKVRTSLDARFEALPEIFRDRISLFRNTNPEFRVEYESCEVFVSEQAVSLAQWAAKQADTPEEQVHVLDEFYHIPPSEQEARWPEMDNGHSGNTFGLTVLLAKLYLSDREKVYEVHGAMTPIVGCTKFGCPHPRPPRAF